MEVGRTTRKDIKNIERERDPKSSEKFKQDKYENILTYI